MRIGSPFYRNSTRGLRRRDLVRTYLLRKSFSSYSKVFPHLCVLERDTIRSNIQDVGIHTSRKVVDPNGSVWDRADSRQDTTQDTDVAVAPEPPYVSCAETRVFLSSNTDKFAILKPSLNQLLRLTPITVQLKLHLSLITESPVDQIKHRNQTTNLKNLMTPIIPLKGLGPSRNHAPESGRENPSISL